MAFYFQLFYKTKPPKTIMNKRLIVLIKLFFFLSSNFIVVVVFLLSAYGKKDIKKIHTNKVYMSVWCMTAKTTEKHTQPREIIRNGNK